MQVLERVGVWRLGGFFMIPGIANEGNVRKG